MKLNDGVEKYGFPVFIAAAIVAGAVMWTALENRTPPVEPQTAGAAPMTTAPPVVTSAPLPQASVPPRPTASSTAAASAMPQAVRMVVIGGSSANGNSPDFIGKSLGNTSWVSHAAKDRITFVGGWADSGATTERMAAAAKSMPADVVVVGVDLTDAERDVPASSTTANVEKIVRAVNAPRVILTGALPSAAEPTLATQTNSALQKLASQRGWTFVDVGAPVRSGDGYARGMSADGENPNAAAAAAIGETVRKAILNQ
ncbi:SGNH/GDSL hydrolase family protein [Rhodococcus sp. X156]|uniref:SGNH/GDSL hydrolase family protein n=1 Tax=Rhodococcus sp. X156 TaxID=2499145 RepID=UPI0013E29734|nr:SGNH/GDSL hydrolase family protein [Rhodococcus sp. X156]